jgi:hypothetical protein
MYLNIHHFTFNSFLTKINFSSTFGGGKIHFHMFGCFQVELILHPALILTNIHLMLNKYADRNQGLGFAQREKAKKVI